MQNCSSSKLLYSKTSIYIWIITTVLYINKIVNKALFVFILPFIKKVILVSFIASNKMVSESSQQDVNGAKGELNLNSCFYFLTS